MFPSPVKEDSPQDPTAVRKRLSTILKRAECKHIRFHDLRHTFATASLEHSMDMKALSTIIGHVSSSTTLNIYAHVTDEMQRTAVAKKDRGIGKATPPSSMESASPAMSTPLPRRNMNKSWPPHPGDESKRSPQGRHRQWRDEMHRAPAVVPPES